MKQAERTTADLDHLSTSGRSVKRNTRSMAPSSASLLSLSMVVASLVAAEAAAQTRGPFRAPQATAPAWTYAWSPLEPIGELPRSLAGDELLAADLLAHPAPRIGPFWTAGNPGALVREIGDPFAAFSVGYDDVSGSYGRPLDPGAETRLLGFATAWGPLGERGAGIGRVLVDRDTFEKGAFANVLQPYATEPYAVMDTIGEPVRRTAVQLEGAGSWILGRFGLGLGLGYAQQETRTIESAVPRLNRTATPAVSAGASLTFGSGVLSVATHGRWQQTAETISILSVAAGSRVYELKGYGEPVPINLAATFYDRRFEREAWSAGASVTGTTGSVSWIAFAQTERISSLNFSATFGEGPVDRWKAQGWTAGAAVQALLGSHGWLATIDGHHTTLSGEAQQSDIAGVPFAADEKSFRIGAELRMPQMFGWEAVLRVGLARETRDRRDGLAEIGSNIRAWRPVAGIEVARWLGRAVAISVGGTVAEHNPSGSIPSAASLGPIYGNWIGPELELEATEGHSRAAAVTLLWQARSQTAIWVQARYETVLAPGDRIGALPNAPIGDRSGWKVAAGARLGNR